MQLSHDQYGNYVVQHLVIKGPADSRWVPGREWGG